MERISLKLDGEQFNERRIVYPPGGGPRNGESVRIEKLGRHTWIIGLGLASRARSTISASGPVFPATLLVDRLCSDSGGGREDREEDLRLHDAKKSRRKVEVVET